MVLTGNSNRAANRNGAQSLGIFKQNKVDKRREQNFIPLKYRPTYQNGLILAQAKEITKILRPLTWEETLAKYGARFPKK